MHILAEEGNTYTRARFNVGPGTERRLKSRTVLDCEFPASDRESWYDEYFANVSYYNPFASQSPFLDHTWADQWWGQTPTAADRWSDSLLETGR